MATTATANLFEKRQQSQQQCTNNNQPAAMAMASDSK